MQSCFNSGSEEELDCSSKLIVTLTLDNNKLYQTEVLEFSVACINSPTNQCPCPCFYGTDPGCTCRDLQRTIAVGITKTPVFATYPLSQPHMFNGRPYEEYIPTGDGGTGERVCSDDPYDPEPTCGWARAPDESGVIQDIPNSQGFCCSCPTFGSSSPIPRGLTSCNFDPLGWPANGVPGSAHCLRYDDYWWYRGYVIGPYQLEFDIQVHINTTDLDPEPPPLPPGEATDTLAHSFGTTETEVLTVNPSRTFILNSQRSVSVRLLGDLDSYRQIQNLDGNWVMIPVQPDLSPNEIFTSNLDMWVVLPPEKVTTTGECDLVGVSYAAFRAHAQCSMGIGSCLRNQIYDLGLADTERVRLGMEPLYNITRYGGGWDNARQMAAGADGGGLALRLPLKGVRTSLVTLEVRADDLQLIVNRAPAKILSSEVCTFDGAQCGSFTAISGTGFLKVGVQNTGAIPADFRASVVECSSGVLPVTEEFAAIGPGVTHTFTFELRMETDLEGNRTCAILVTDSAGSVADTLQFSFFTNATEYEPPPNQSDLGDKPGNPGGPPTFQNCSQMCPNVFNFVCAVLKGCWKRLIQAIITLAVIAAIVATLWLCVSKGWLMMCVRAVFGSSKNSRRRSIDGSRNRKRRRRSRRGSSSTHGMHDATASASRDKPPSGAGGSGPSDIATVAAAAVLAKQWQAAKPSAPYAHPPPEPQIAAFHGPPSPAALYMYPQPPHSSLPPSRLPSAAYTCNGSPPRPAFATPKPAAGFLCVSSPSAAPIMHSNPLAAMPPPTIASSFAAPIPAATSFSACQPAPIEETADGDDDNPTWTVLAQKDIHRLP